MLRIFSYVGQDPVNTVDPQGLAGGEAACIAPEVGFTIPICAGSIISDIATIGAAAWATSHHAEIPATPTTAVNSASGICTAASPQGNCTPEQQQRYQENVENQCGAAKACYGTDTVDVLTQKIGQQSRCIDARRLINDVCYGGGDAGHQQQISERVNAIKNCQELLTQQHLR